MIKACTVLMLVIVALLNSATAAVPEFTIILKDHLFYPSTINIPANKKVKFVIHNQDNTPEEFDSFSLNREKVIFANRSTSIFIGPLKPGVYDFFGEYHPHKAQGKVIVSNPQQDNQNAD